MFKFCFTTLFYFFFSFSLMAQVNEDYAFKSTRLTQFTYELKHSIFESIDNANLESLRRKKFAYEPLWYPQMNSAGDFNYKKKLRDNGNVLCLLPIIIYNSNSDNQALESIKNYFVNEGKIGELSVNNIDVINIESVIIADIHGLNDVNFIKETERYSVGNSKTIYLRLQFNSEGEFDKFVKLMPSMRIDLEMIYDVKFVKSNTCLLTISDTRQIFSDLRLSGDTNQKVNFVNRHDLKDLIFENFSKIDIECFTENPTDEDINNITTTLLDYWTNQMQETYINFSDEAFKETYNSEDLSPDIVERLINEQYKYDETTNAWKETDSKSGAGNASFNVFKILSGSVGGKGKKFNSEEELKSYLAKNDIIVDFEGKKIIPKSLKVFSIKDNMFNSNKIINSKESFVTDGKKGNTASIEYANFAPTDTTNKDKLVASSFSFSPNLLPLGSIIYSVVPPEIFIKENKGWQEIKGQSIENTHLAELYSKYNMNINKLPDFKGAFIRPYQKGITQEVGVLQVQNTAMPVKFKVASSFNTSSLNHVHTHSDVMISQNVNYLNKHSGLSANNGFKDLMGMVSQGLKDVDWDNRLVGKDDRKTLSTKWTNPKVNVSSKVSGWDKETRPSNIALYTYIKVNK